ncbi:unnamed protein product, partial [Prorocentrum cordatum]
DGWTLRTRTGALGVQFEHTAPSTCQTDLAGPAGWSGGLLCSSAGVAKPQAPCGEPCPTWAEGGSGAVCRVAMDPGLRRCGSFNARSQRAQPLPPWFVFHLRSCFGGTRAQQRALRGPTEPD